MHHLNFLYFIKYFIFLRLLDLHQVPAGLTREQRYTVDRMVEAHRLYRTEDGGHSRVGKASTPPEMLKFQLPAPHSFWLVSL